MKIKARLDAFCKEQGLSNAQVAKSIGFSAAYLSKALNKDDFKYKTEVLTKLEDFLNSFAPKKAQLSSDFIHTIDAKAIFNVIDWVVADGEMGAIIGVAGSGKTRAIKEYVSTHPQALLFEGATTVTPKALLNALCKLLGINSVGTSDNVLRIIANELTRRTHTLIIDEAEHLNHRCLEILRRIHDFSSTPLVLVGTNKLLNNLNGNGKNNYYEYEQLSSRVGSKWILKGLANDEAMSDLRQVCKDYGVVDGECINTIYALARGNFRSTLKLLNRAKRLNQNISVKTLKNAASMLLIKGA
ncbi:AAA family ATPase [Campylobacter sp. RM12640]|uniref:AAA family ATPase n=1 Tax=unclassified Campylobacter TaxID=2593542 RepID=UPI0030144722|nr:AAA family ATPase [Campylobacter sp. RM12640]MBZ7989947.1 AAA family ATPase [Campylobacter sp. RM12635]